MPFLHRRAQTEAALNWWREAYEAYPSAAPNLVQQLARSESVVADGMEIRQAVGWARVHPAWRDEDPPFVQHESVIAPEAGPAGS